VGNTTSRARRRRADSVVLPTVRINLIGAFNSTEGFENITEVTWNSSQRVRFNVVLRGVQPGQVMANLNKTIDNLAADSMFNKTILQENFKLFVDTALENSCKQISCIKNYACDYNGQNVSCLHKCSQNSAKDVCPKDAYCYVDDDDNIACRCPENGNFLYGGVKCEVSAEKLALESKYIIAIAASIGGVLVVILVIVIACIARQRQGFKKRLEKENILDNISQSSDDRAGYYNTYLSSPTDLSQGVSRVHDNTWQDQQGSQKLAQRKPEPLQPSGVASGSSLPANNPKLNDFIHESNIIMASKEPYSIKRPQISLKRVV
jgi:hypothetical protein